MAGLVLFTLDAHGGGGETDEEGKDRVDGPRKREREREFSKVGSKFRRKIKRKAKETVEEIGRWEK